MQPLPGTSRAKAVLSQMNREMKLKPSLGVQPKLPRVNTATAETNQKVEVAYETAFTSWSVAAQRRMGRSPEHVQPKQFRIQPELSHAQPELSHAQPERK